MILVTGASGQLGRLVIEHLLGKIPPDQVVAAVRNTEKAHDLRERGIVVRQADYDQPEQWPSALEGVDKILLISAPDVGNRVKQAKSVIDAATNSGAINLFAYTSILRADVSKISYAAEDRAIEKMISSSGVPSVFLRHGWYTENYTMNAGYAVETGYLYGCAKNGRISGASRNDYAEAAATVLTLPRSPKKIYELSGDTSFTLAEVAKEISRQSGKDVFYQDMSEHEYQSLLISYGLSQSLASTLAIADTGAAEGEVYFTGGQLSELISRPSTPLTALVAASLSGSLKES